MAEYVISVETLINRIENEKDVCLTDGWYGYSFHKIGSYESNPVVKTLEENNPGKFMVVCSINTCYGPTHRLENGFNRKELESLASFIYYPEEDGSYDGGPFLVERTKLYEFFKNSQQ